VAPLAGRSAAAWPRSSEMTRSEALRRHPERHLQITLRPVAGDSGAPRHVLVQKRPPQVPSNVRLQVLLFYCTVLYFALPGVDPPSLERNQ